MVVRARGPMFRGIIGDASRVRRPATMWSYDEEMVLESRAAR